VAGLDRANSTEYPMYDVHRLIERGPVVVVSTFDGHRANLMTNGFTTPIAHGALIGLVVGPWTAATGRSPPTRPLWTCAIA
jgi:flavin reductase (DIM6/NTAB) family NADH-FMN oxidoreductase RutF